MTCEHCQDADKTFSSDLANRELKDYRAHGPGKTTRLLIEALKAAGIDGLTLLDIGGGVGVIQHELFQAGASSAVAVDASSGYLQAAEQEAERQGYAEHVRYRHGDFVDLAPQLQQAGIVTLDKVICCYPDMRALVSLSSAHAEKLYGVVFPRDTWWLKLGLGFVNRMQWLRRSSFRVFVHSTEAIEAVVREQGLARRYYRQTILWQVILYAR